MQPIWDLLQIAIKVLTNEEFIKFLQMLLNMPINVAENYATKFNALHGGFGCPCDPECPDCPDDCKDIESKLLSACEQQAA